jgi:hypothetical protein
LLADTDHAGRGAIAVASRAFDPAAGLATRTAVTHMNPDHPSRGGMAASNRMIGSRIVERSPRTGGAPETIMLFPIARQDHVIHKVAAAIMRKRSPAAADRCIGQALRERTHEMRRQGIPAATIRGEVHTMEALIRGAVWRLMFPWNETEQIRGQRRRRESHKHYRSDAPAEQLAFSWNGDGQ